MDATASALEYHQQALRRLLAMLLVYAGLTDENEQVRSHAAMRERACHPFTLSRKMRAMVLRLLVPVEAATRRLIVVLASRLSSGERYLAARLPARPAALGQNTPTPQGRGGQQAAAPLDGSTPQAPASQSAASPTRAYYAQSGAFDQNTPTPNPSPQGGGELQTAVPSGGLEPANLTPHHGENPQADRPRDAGEQAARTDSPPPCGEGLGVGVGRARTVPGRAVWRSASHQSQAQSAPHRRAPSAQNLTQSPSTPPRLPLFALADTPKRFDWFFNPRPEGQAPWAGPGAERADPHARLDALPIMRRVAALAIAFDDLPRQARRFLHWRAMRLRARASGKHCYTSPLRVGFPPGSPPYRTPEKHKLPEHHILKDINWFAREAINRLDSS